MPTITSIIAQDDPQGTVDLAKALAKKLKEKDQESYSNEAKESSKTQIRKLFATLRQIQMTWRQSEDDGYRELVLFGPRLLYQASKNKSLEPLTISIQEGITAVGKDSDKLQRLVDYFEAVVAYYVAF